MVGGVWVESQRGSALGSNSRAGGPLSKCLSCGSFRTTPSSPAAPTALGKAQSSLLRGELPPGCPLPHAVLAPVSCHLSPHNEYGSAPGTVGAVLGLRPGAREGARSGC